MVKGLLYQGALQSGFCLTFNSPSNNLQEISKPQLLSLITKKKIKKSISNNTMEVCPKIFTADFLDKLKAKSLKKQKSKNRKGFDMYDHITTWNSGAKNTSDLLT